MVTLNVRVLLAAGIATMGMIFLFGATNPMKSVSLPEQRNVSFDLSPDGKSLVFTAAGRGGSDLYLMDIATRRISAITQSADLETSPAFAADSQHIIFAASPALNGDSSLYQCALDGSSRKRLTALPGVYDMGPSYDRKQSMIIFSRALLSRPYSMGGMAWDNWDVFAIRPDGSHLRQLTHQQYRHMGTTTASEGVVAFDAQLPDEDALCLFRTSLSATPALPLKLTRGPREGGPSFAPGGSLLFVSDVNTAFEYEIWRMRSDGTRPTQVTHGHAQFANPRVSPDGKHLYYLSDHSSLIRYDLCESERDGTHPRVIADSSIFDQPLRWKSTDKPHSMISAGMCSHLWGYLHNVMPIRQQ